jgi:response regulator RpfG family c-di-GMP phosphodiesterase
MNTHYLVVAGDSQVRQSMAAELRRGGFNLTLAENGAQAVLIAQSVQVDVALVESHLSDMTLDDLRKKLVDCRPKCRVISMTSYDMVRNKPAMLQYGSGHYLIGIDQLLDTPTTATVDSDASNWISPSNQSLMRVIDVLVGLLELEYSEFGVTSHVAMQLARGTAVEMGAGHEMLYEVVLGTLLRDIGKLGLRGGSAATEAAECNGATGKEQIQASLRLLESVEFPWKVLPVIRHHREHYDGTGIPDGLKGREIPMASRIVTVVGAYVELTAGEDGKGVNPVEAIADLNSRAGREFDPEVLEAFQRVIDKRNGGRTSKGRPTVVLVEPDTQFRRLLKVRLANLGMKVNELPNYERCKERMLKNPPDLVLIGIDKEPEEAFQTLAEVQEDDNLCRIPVVFISSSADHVVKVRALRQGVDDFLTKSDNMEELLARVENILIRRAIRSEGEKRGRRRGVTGSLENLSLPDIVQTLTIGMKTACVTLRSEKLEGRLWFDNGTLHHAESGKSSGDEAFYEMVGWDSGEFVIEHGSKSRESSIEQDAMFLLMEGLRMIDEGRESQAVS